LGIILNLGALFIYKYSGWCSEIPGLGFLPKLALPLGISFFTFHAISYLVDVYRKDIMPAGSVIEFACYFVMFPHLVAGPIVRFSHVQNDLKDRKYSIDSFYNGICRFVIGLAKKTLIANQVAVVADAAFASPTETLGTTGAWLGAVAYTLQIYFDFSAYSDMAIGLATMFGFRFHENFNHPYGANSMQDFWKKWHISLSTWLRDYLYIPLGGNRKGSSRTYSNLILVFLFCGLWHGANWTFVIWGLYHGVFLVLERLKAVQCLKLKLGVFMHVYVTLVIIFGWVIFRADSIAQANHYLLNMIIPNSIEIPVQVDYNCSHQFWAALVIGIIASTGAFASLWVKIRSLLVTNTGKVCWELGNLVYGVAIAILSIMALLAGTYNPFIYFRF
jgi:alginate O-acetyltransferase complex protein AlgI